MSFGLKAATHLQNHQGTVGAGGTRNDKMEVMGPYVYQGVCKVLNLILRFCEGRMVEGVIKLISF